MLEKRFHKRSLFLLLYLLFAILPVYWKIGRAHV